MTSPRTLLELLADRSREGAGSHVAYDLRSGTYQELTSRQLERASTAASAGLLEASGGGGGGNRYVLVAMPDPLSFIIGFFAAMWAGLVPVPAPSRPLQHRGHLQRLRSMVISTRPLAVLTDQSTSVSLAEVLPDESRVVSLDELAGAGGPQPFDATTQDVAYVQYTSGSVSDPKPVRLRQENVIAQLRLAAAAYGEDTDSVSITWVPLYHDMGLITGVLRPLWSGYTSVLIDPFDFVREPALWPRMMSEWKATHTSAPDSGYRLCARKVTGARRFDLRPLRVARSAGEPVRAGTIRSFAETFRPAGFDGAAFKPSYGLAEATLTVTTCPLDRPPSSAWVSTKALRNGQIQVSDGGTDSTEIVSCGTPLEDTRVEILDLDTRDILGPRQLGEVWISGPQVVPGNGSAHTVTGHRGHRTGDLGFIHRGELFLLGRGTERFQVDGANFYSGEIEAIADGADPRLRPGRTAVFLGQVRQRFEPVVVVVAECRDADEIDDDAGAQIAKAVVAAVGRKSGLSVGCVWLVPRGALPVTTSGKVQREHCRVAFEDQVIETLYRLERRGR